MSIRRQLVPLLPATGNFPSWLILNRKKGATSGEPTPQLCAKKWLSCLKRGEASQPPREGCLSTWVVRRGPRRIGAVLGSVRSHFGSARFSVRFGRSRRGRVKKVCFFSSHETPKFMKISTVFCCQYSCFTTQQMQNSVVANLCAVLFSKKYGVGV